MPDCFDAHSHLFQDGAQPPEHPVVVCGTCEADWPTVFAQAAATPRLLPMLGLHPASAGTAAPGWLARLEALLRAQRAGVGECGLDFARKQADRSLQLAAFRQQVRLAQALHRPVAMHVVQAWGPLLELLHEEGVPSAGAMVHAFSGSIETARALGRQGVFLSFSGAILDPRRTRLRQVLAGIEAEQLLVETDGQADLDAVIAGVAELRGTSPEAIAALTWENGLRCFRELMA